jgi:serine/threonine-protein kinase HipA
VTDSLIVIAGSLAVGTLNRLRGGNLHFTYTDEYSSLPDGTPLSVSMPTQTPVHADGVVTPWLWGLLPDNEQVLQRWARRFDLTRITPFTILSTPVGNDCAGAVRFVRQENVEVHQPGSVTWLNEDEVASRLRELREDSANWLGTAFTGQFSLAGAQAKTALLHQDGRWGVPSGETPTTHILKPAIAGLDDHDLNEHLCLEAAHRTGLHVVRTSVQQFGSESAIVVRRYDRRGTSDGIQRIHQEDICQALSVHPLKKYQSDGGPGIRDVVGLFRTTMAPRVADLAVRQFADALAWNWIIGGTDAHAKNYSLLLSGRDVRLAPLYDIASALPYGYYEDKLRMAMKIGGDYLLNPYRNRWHEAADELGMPADELLTRIRQLTAAAPDAFADAAKAPGVAALGRDLPATLTDMVADRTVRCLRQLGTGG